MNAWIPGFCSPVVHTVPGRRLGDPRRRRPLARLHRDAPADEPTHLPEVDESAQLPTRAGAPGRDHDGRGEHETRAEIDRERPLRHRRALIASPATRERPAAPPAASAASWVVRRAIGPTAREQG